MERRIGLLLLFLFIPCLAPAASAPSGQSQIESADFRLSIVAAALEPTTAVQRSLIAGVKWESHVHPPVEPDLRLWWTAPDGTRQAMALRAVDDIHWASRVSLDASPASHALELVVLAPGPGGMLDRVYRHSYLIEFPSLALTPVPGGGWLDSAISEPEPPRPVAAPKPAKASPMLVVLLLFLFNLGLVFAGGAVIVVHGHLPERLRKRLGYPPSEPAVRALLETSGLLAVPAPAASVEAAAAQPELDPVALAAGSVLAALDQAVVAADAVAIPSGPDF